MVAGQTVTLLPHGSGGSTPSLPTINIWRVAGVWLIGAVLKTAGGAEPSVGSNPTPSSIWNVTQAGLRGQFAKLLGGLVVREFESPTFLQNNMRKTLVGRVRDCKSLVSEFDSHLLLHKGVE